MNAPKQTKRAKARAAVEEVLEVEEKGLRVVVVRLEGTSAQIQKALNKLAGGKQP